MSDHMVIQTVIGIQGQHGLANFDESDSWLRVPRFRFWLHWRFSPFFTCENRFYRLWRFWENVNNKGRRWLILGLLQRPFHVSWTSQNWTWQIEQNNWTKNLLNKSQLVNNNWTKNDLNNLLIESNNFDKKVNWTFF